jgi:hypothetical protein
MDIEQLAAAAAAAAATAVTAGMVAATKAAEPAAKRERAKKRASKVQVGGKDFFCSCFWVLGPLHLSQACS